MLLSLSSSERWTFDCERTALAQPLFVAPGERTVVHECPLEPKDLVDGVMDAGFAPGFASSQRLGRGARRQHEAERRNERCAEGTTLPYHKSELYSGSLTRAISRW
jgi:hypothetical protein